MGRNRMIWAVGGGLLAVAAATWLVIFLTGQGMERANQWSSVLQLFVSPTLTIAGLVVSWLAWRDPRPTTPVNFVPSSSGRSVSIDVEAGRDVYTAARDMTINQRPEPRL